MYQRESSPSLLGHYLAKPASVAHRLKVRSSPGRSSPVCFFNSFIWDGERKVSRNYVNWSNQLLSQQLPHASTPHLPSLQCRRWLMVAPMYYNGTISHEWCEMGIVECWGARRRTYRLIRFANGIQNKDLVFSIVRLGGLWQCALLSFVSSFDRGESEQLTNLMGLVSFRTKGRGDWLVTSSCVSRGD